MDPTDAHGSSDPHGSQADIFDFIAGLWAGDIAMWITLGAIAACIGVFAVYEKATGSSFVKGTDERRRAEHRRKHVLWERRRNR